MVPSLAENDFDDVVDTEQIVGFAVGRKRARAMHVLGDDIVAAVLLARVVDRQNVRMLESAHHLGLVEEHFARHPRLVLVFVLDEV
jgi:hypothetical protein